MINITNSINNKQMFECGYVCGRKLMPVAIMLFSLFCPKRTVRLYVWPDFY